MMKYNKERPLRVATLCSGYDSQCIAFERLKKNFPEFDYDLVFWSEFDPESKQQLEKQPAVIAHNAIFPQWADRNLGDMTLIDWENVPDFDLVFGSTPCQSISQAGLQHGFVKDSGTRSSIIWNMHDCIRIKRPKYIVMENVAAILSGKFLPLLLLWCEEVEKMGYVNFMPPEFETPWNGGSTRNGTLNSKNYGVPQNRERWFMVSILRTEDEPDPKYYFPEPFPLDKRLKDVLEDKVDEKYYINDKLLDKIMSENAEVDDDDEQSSYDDAMYDCGSLFDDEDYE